MKNTIKNAMNKIQEAVDLLETIKGQNSEVDGVREQLEFDIADLEFEHNSI